MRRGRVFSTLLVLAAMALSTPAWAQAELAYTGRGVPVDQTAASAAQAREAALASGQRLALRQVFERLTPRSEARRWPQVSASRLTDMVASFEVEDERVSATRYLGRLTVRFRPDDVRALLRNADIPIAETFAQPVVVLPVLLVGNTAMLWEPGNAWREAWTAMPRPDGLAPMIVPLGDLDDSASISVQDAVAGNREAVARIARRYEAAGALVAVARASSPASQSYRIELTRVGVTGGALPGFEAFGRRGREDDPTYLRRAAAAVVEQVEESWKADVMLQFGREGRLVAYAPIHDLRQWVALRTQLGNVAAVRRSDLLSLSRAEAMIEITYIGDESALRLALAQRNIQLADEGGRWRLQSTGAQ
jgi:hypothetical protein